MVILTQMLVLFMLMMTGVVAYKKHILTTEASQSLAAIVVNISNPALILSSVVGEYQKAPFEELVVTSAVAISMFIILILISFLMVGLLRPHKKDANIYGMMTVFSNIGFMGFPIISAVYGKEALIYAAIFLIPYNLLIYTYGVKMMSGSEYRKSIQIRQIMNIGVIASMVTIILFMADIKITGWLGSSITILSGLTAPISMMLIGASLARSNIKEIFKDKRLIGFALIRQFVIPVALGGLVLRIISQQVIAGITIIMLSVPVGSMCAMLAQNYNQDEELVSRGVALTTIISIVSIPLVVGLLVGNTIR